MRFVLAALLVAGCSQGDGQKYDIPTGGGGGGGGGGGSGELPDAGTGSGSGSGSQITGLVCLVSDLRQPNACATSGAGGYTVKLDGATATTAADGSFAIAAPTSTNVMFEVDGADIATSLMAYSAAHRIPIVKAVDYVDLQNTNGMSQVGSTGDVFVHVVHAGTSVGSVGGTVTPAATYSTLYDGSTAGSWTMTGTSMYGMIWFPGIPMGSATLSITPQGQATTVVNAVPVGDGTITWVTQSI